MARITYSALVDRINGSIGGTTFQNNKYGYTVKAKGNTVKPNSELQNQQKLYFTAATKNWSLITVSERAQWDTYASTYPQYAKNNPTAELNGFNVFVKWQQLYMFANEMIVTDLTSPNLTNYVYDPPSVGVSLVAGVLRINFDFTIDDDTLICLYYITPPRQQTKNFTGSSPRFINTTPNIDGTDIITTKYIALYGALPAVGDYVTVRITQIGQYGGKVFAPVDFTVQVT